MVVDQYLDTRPEEEGGGRLMQLTDRGCIEKTLGYAWASTIYSIDNIVLCPDPLKYWSNNLYIDLDGFLNSDIQGWGDFTWTLSVTTVLWIEGVLIHELTHSQHLLAPDLWTGTLLKDT